MPFKAKLTDSSQLRPIRWFGVCLIDLDYPVDYNFDHKFTWSGGLWLV